MRRIVSSALTLFVCVSLAAGQESPRSSPARPALGSTGTTQEGSRGIEKKDIRALLAYPENVYSPADVQRMEAAVRKVVDEIAWGAKLTKADAARQSQPASGGPSVFDRIEAALRARSRAVFLGMTVQPSSAGNRPIACPPPGCGCDQQGHGVTCACGLLNNPGMGPFCLCALCYEKHELTTFPEPDLRQAAPGRPAAPAVLVFVATPPDAPAQVRQHLVESAVKTLQSEPWPAGLTIKTRSIQSIINGGPSSTR